MKRFFHVVDEGKLVWGTDDRYRPPSLVQEGFVHASFREAVLESARLYFAPDARLLVMVIDPEKLDVPVRIEMTPRGPMPHIFGPIPRRAVQVIAIGEFSTIPA